MVCIQETKVENVNEDMCRLIWGNVDCGWAVREAEGRSGG